MWLGFIELVLKKNWDIDKFSLEGNLLYNGCVGKIRMAKAKGTGFGTQLVDLLTRQIDGEKLIQEVVNAPMMLINF